MTKTRTDRKISVRLDPEADSRLREAISNGYTTSRYINDLIKGTAIIDIGQYRQLIPPLCNLETLLEHEKDSAQKGAMRKEIRELWRSLKSFQENT